VVEATLQEETEELRKELQGSQFPQSEITEIHQSASRSQEEANDVE